MISSFAGVILSLIGIMLAMVIILPAFNLFGFHYGGDITEIKQTLANEDCFLFKSNTLAIIKYANNNTCHNEVDAMIKSGFKIVAVTADFWGSSGSDGRIYLTK